VRPEQVTSNYLPPEGAAEVAARYHCASIAYTYSEPVIFFEYMIDTAERAHAAGIKSAVVTGGYIQPEPLKLLCGKVDAIKVDLKAYSEKFYRETVNGELKPVLNALVEMRKLGMWTEIVYLVVPTLNDGEQEFRGLARWVRTYLGTDVPPALLAFSIPNNLLRTCPRRPLSTLERAHSIAAAEGLHYVYIGNVPGHPPKTRYCPKCRARGSGTHGLRRARYALEEREL
jgi:pyruvate formate lyase activating enzyme